MAQAKKFGAFAGVFTPSILTILGVIMYMRLGWVVGQAGLITTIVIILIAHIISLSTGLSISSIATDKRIKTGGIYYILSRSLGLPMGGAIGITLFVGTALSISLYIIGFAESFFSVAYIRDFFDIATDAGAAELINYYRVTGTIVISILVILALISTSLAIKMQFFILAAIGLSLVSIGVGFWLKPEFAPAAPLLYAVKDGVSLELVFAIFFPAVTGFTAGVAMSGDLKDPKKTIPVGTMAAIAVGFVVYVALAASIAFFVNRDLLLNDINFLSQVAWVGFLVVLGIWGATLSSALGGILGAPRILQATSNDKITPAFLGKGYGASNEPRNALIFTFVIAELGILVGELNAIAGVVSMFYLASYGFINLAYVLESLASTDFRPSFKMPSFVGVVGFVASFAVMFKLDMFAMLIALLFMGGIFFYLKKKEIQLDFGDVWQSVWSWIIRIALHQMDKKEIEKRNWQPNVILFSGGTQKRPHLLRFGKSLVGKYGMLSNFDLYENKSAKVLFPKHKQSVQEEKEGNKGVFTRQQSCLDIYEGIEMIARTYGFSGVEPNTILMGWARQTKNPKRFAQLLKTLSDLDLNILLIDYDKRYGFGKFKQIDIWWRNTGHHGNFALSLSKFMLASTDWADAQIRLMIVNPINDESENIQKNAEQVLENMRINATVRVINNQIEKKPFYDIIRQESLHSDLIILGVPEIPAGSETEFVEKTSILMQDIGTVMLMQASSLFKEQNFGRSQKEKRKAGADFAGSRLVIKENVEIQKLQLPENKILANQIEALQVIINSQIENYYTKYFTKFFAEYDTFSYEFNKLIGSTFNYIIKKVETDDLSHSKQQLIKSQKNFLLRSYKLIKQFSENHFQQQETNMRNGINFYLKEFEQKINNQPNYLIDNYSYKQLAGKAEDKNRQGIGFYKFWNRLKIQITGHPIEYRIHYKDLLHKELSFEIAHSIYQMLAKWGLMNAQYIIELKKQIRNTRNSLLACEQKLSAGNFDKDFVKKEQENLQKQMLNLTELTQKSHDVLYQFFRKEMHKSLQSISSILSQLHANQIIRNKEDHSKTTLALRQKIEEIPSLWLKNQQLLYNATGIELKLFVFENKLKHVFSETNMLIQKMFHNAILKNLIQLQKLIVEYREKISQNTDSQFVVPDTLLNNETNYYLLFKEILDETFRKLKLTISKFPETIEIMNDDSLNEFQERQFADIQIVTISTSRLLDYLIQEELIEPLQNLFGELPEQLQQVKSLINNTVRLISFSTESLNENESEKNLLDFIDEQLEKVNKTISESEGLQNEILKKMDGYIVEVTEKLNLYSITKIAAKLKQYIKEQADRKRFSLIRKKSMQLNNFVATKYNQFLYRKSEMLLLAQNISKESASQNTVNKILNLVEIVSANSKTLQNLPFYYQQLFLRKHHYYKEFWVGRKQELAEIEKAIQRYQNTASGGILITGKQNSGKTFLAQYACNLLYHNAIVYMMRPPEGGSISKQVFRKELSKTLELNGSYAQIFNNLEANSVLIIDDLELWWEKSEQGFEVINQIIQLIENYSHQCLFVVNVNIHSFKLINQIQKIDKYFLNIIDCQAFSPEEIKDIVLFRHKSSGLNLKLENKQQEQLKSRDMAQLFSKYFSYSQGNIGTALLAWIANISNLDKNSVNIHSPKIPDTGALDNLESDDFLIILQFILHKYLNISKLKRIMFSSEKELKNKLAYLLRVGIIHEASKESYELNRFLYIFLENKLVDLKML